MMFNINTVGVNELGRNELPLLIHISNLQNMIHINTLSQLIPFILLDNYPRPFNSPCISCRTYFSVAAVPCCDFVAARNRTYCLSLQTSQELNFKSLIKFVAPISLLFLVTIKLRKRAL
jgi:hypothetical protein